MFPFFNISSATYPLGPLEKDITVSNFLGNMPLTTQCFPQDKYYGWGSASVVHDVWLTVFNQYCFSV